TRYSDKKKIFGEVISVLGQQDSLKSCIEGIILGNDIKQEFDKETLNEADKIPQTVTENQFAGREDLRDMIIFTIDGDDARDFDDAVSLTLKNNGNYYLGVHIADVSEYVKEGTALENEAYKRGTSVYLADRVIPMLPTSLSNGICSLNPQVDRLTLSVFMEITGDGNVVSHKLCKSVICSKERMTYNNVNKMLEDGDEELCERYKHILPTLKLMEDLAQILKNKRTLRGAIQFDFPESNIVVNENGEPIEIEKEVRGTSNKMIEEFMLSANETIAEYAFWSEIPFVYRNHEAPTLEKIMTFNEFILHFGVSFKGKIDRDTPIHPKALQQILDTVKDTPQERIVASTMLHSLMKAKYSEENLGHFGLAAKYYCHFTSPIRRYPDLAIHRILKDFLDGKVTGNRISYLAGYVSAASKHSSDCEVNAETAERDVDDLMKTAYMSSFIGQTFEGVVANVTNFGMFVELDNSVEGLIRVENMTDDYYEYDEKVNTLTGRRKQKSYTTGDVVNIVVARTDILSRQIDFVLAKDADRKLLKKFAKPIEIPKSEKHGKKSKRKKSFKKYNKKKK
ncbi:MAG: ribonuclease R, partial [Clostridia bacterium]|nr:ribonuclease R [Clostridia bacterium]